MSKGEARRGKPTAVLLSCDHIISFYPIPRPGDRVYCLRCGSYRFFVHVDAWRIRCKDCKMARSYGEDENSARRTAIKHVGRFAGHRMDVIHAGKIDSTVRAQDQPIPGSLPDRYHIVTL